jgi:DNA-binding winged helix-turn-helix (wHTH) protein
MSQQNLATVDSNALPSNPASRRHGSWPPMEIEQTSEERQRVPHAVVTGPWSSPGASPADRNIALAGPAMSFGPFHLLPRQRLVLKADQPLRLGSRAFDILVTLVERTGEVVSKSELMARIWPHTFVEEGNLKVQIAALRRALADGEDGSRYIANVAGRGYCFVTPVIHLRRGPSPDA